MEEDRIENAVGFVEAFRKEFSEKYCNICIKKKTGECNRSNPNIVSCIVKKILGNL